MIEVAGCIASGKTTLVDALEGRFKPVYEDHTVNPFWQAFYRNPSACAFETEIAFLLQHYHFAKVAGSGSQRVMILDHSFELDMAYAEVGLEGRRMDIFRSLYREVRAELGDPMVLVWIMCGAEEAMRRIKARARTPETALPLQFLVELERKLEQRILEMSQRVPIIRVNSEVTDFRKMGSWVAEIVADLEKLLDTGSGTSRQRSEYAAKSGARNRVESYQRD